MHRIPLVPCLLLLACDSGPNTATNGQFGEEEDTLCVEQSRTVLDADATVTVEGHDGSSSLVPADVVAAIEGSTDAGLYWGDPPEVEDDNGDPIPPEEQEVLDTTPVTVSIAVDGDAVYELVEYTNPDGLEIACGSRIESVATVTITTEDTLIDVTHTGRMWLGPEGATVDFAVTEDTALDPRSLVDDPSLVHPSWYRLHTDFEVDGAVSGRVLAVDASGDVEEDAPTLGGW